MVTMFARHKVADYAKWKRVYDEFDQKAAGVTAAGIYRDADDPSTLIITHTFKDLSAAKGFADSPDLGAAMERAGVHGKPEFWFGEEIERT